MKTEKNKTANKYFETILAIFPFLLLVGLLTFMFDEVIFGNIWSYGESWSLNGSTLLSAKLAMGFIFFLIVSVRLLSNMSDFIEMKIKKLINQDKGFLLGTIVVSIITAVSMLLYMVNTAKGPIPVYQDTPFLEMPWCFEKSIVCGLIAAITLVFGLIPWIPHFIRKHNQPWAH